MISVWMYLKNIIIIKLDKILNLKKIFILFAFRKSCMLGSYIFIQNITVNII